MKRLRDSIPVRAKFEQLQDTLDDYFFRLKLDARVKRLTKKVEEYEEKCGIKRYQRITSNIDSPYNDQVSTRGG
tara:strand:- start:256 stop:477 length:222 start_codon:yes stop_codon:yes gene_type:complete